MSKKGFFGRLFGRKDDDKPTPEVEQTEGAEIESAPLVSDEPEALAPQEASETVAEPVFEAPAAPEPELVAEVQPEPEFEPEPEAEEVSAPEVEEPAKTGWLSRLKAGLSKTTGKLAGGIGDLFTKRKLDDEALEELEELLITADLGVSTAGRVTKRLAQTRFGQDVGPEEIKAALATEVAEILEPVAKPLVPNYDNKPHVILVVGVNGAGKTTTIGKMAKSFKDEGRSVMLAAGDTFRAAAVEQLKVWGERTNTPVVSRETGADAAGLAFDAIAQARETNTDLLFIDTAGRLQNKTDLMAELEKIVRVIKKQDPTAPHDVLLVLDSTVGQNAHSQVEIFREMVGVTGLILTKLDGTARGGVLVALADKFKLPVHAIGVGEKISDLRPFVAKDYARSLVGLD